MTSENDAKRPTQDPGQPPEKSKSPLAAINDSAVAQKAKNRHRNSRKSSEKPDYCAPAARNRTF